MAKSKFPDNRLLRLVRLLRRLGRKIVVGSLLAALLVPALSASPAAVLHFDAETTDGKTLSFPDDARGKPLVLVVGLTEASAKDSAQWSLALETNLGARASVFGVAVLDRVPGFVRGSVKRAIDKQIGPPQSGQAGFVTTFDGRALRSHAPAGNENDPVIFVFGPDGSLASIERAAFSQDAARQLERTIP